MFTRMMNEKQCSKATFPLGRRFASANGCAEFAPIAECRAMQTMQVEGLVPAPCAGTVLQRRLVFPPNRRAMLHPEAIHLPDMHLLSGPRPHGKEKREQKDGRIFKHDT